MNKKRTEKILLTTLTAAILIVSAAICAWAVPARPGSGHEGEAAHCRSHHGALVTLDDIPERRGGAQRAPSIAPAEKDIPLLTIVIGFSNIAYEDGYDWSKEMFSGEKSLSAYYSDMSFGKFTFTPAPETAAYGVGDNTNTADKVNDGVVHVKLSTAHMDWANEDENPAMARAMIAALNAADPYVDFASFDADGNGKITENELAVGFVFAGYEASAAYSYPQGIEKYLWAHAWTISDIRKEDSTLTIPTPDGTAVDAYIAIAEQLEENEQEPISVLAHELGHYLGLPDLYDTLNTPSYKWGKYDVSNCSVMSSGSWGIDPDGGYIPYSMDVWSRYALGWCEPQTADSDGDYAVIAQSYTEDEAFAALYLPTQREGEYYLLENRQFTKWDAGLAEDYDSDGGVIVWHIDDAVFERYNANNQVNDTNHRPAVMPLYPEKQDGAYTYVGNTARVYTTQPFYSASAWAALFDNDTALDLPLYGEGSNADKRDARTLSGIKLSFLDESEPEMDVRLSTADHVHFLREKERVEPTCETAGAIAHWACTYCGAPFADAEGQTPLTAAEVLIHALDHQFVNYIYNNDATCAADGTETAVCENGCGEADTRAVEGTRLPHTYGAPVWTWADDYSSATATFTCVCCDVQTATDRFPAKTEVSAATAAQDQVVTYSAAVTFGGETYETATGNVPVPGTATGTQEDPDAQSGDLCPLDGVDHGNTFFGKIIRFVHGIMYFFSHLFGK